MLIKGEVDVGSSVIWGHGITLLIRRSEGLDSHDAIFRKLENAQRRFLLSMMMTGIKENTREAGKK